MHADLDKIGDHHGFLRVQVHHINWQIMIEMVCWIVARALVARDHHVVALAPIHGASLLEVSGVVVAIPQIKVPQINAT